MLCLYAFTLFSSAKSFYDIYELPAPPSRLLIVGDGREPYYGLFELPVAPKFPTTNIEINPFEKYYDATKRQTQIAAYCSDFYTLNQIKVVMTKGLHPLPQTSTRLFDREYQKDNQCHKHLQKISLNENKATKIRLSKVMKLKKCSLKAIASLASRNEISLSGKYRGFLSPGRTGTINVLVDFPIEINDVLDQGKAILGTNEDATGQAVALFQGNLHLFQKDPSTKTWFLKTSLRPTMENGKLIAQFFDSHFKFGQEVDQYIETVETSDGPSILHNTWKDRPYDPNLVGAKKVIPLYQKLKVPPFSYLNGAMAAQVSSPLEDE